MIKDEILEHHGIPNMRWYHRNGPPYPLDRKTHNKVVNKKSTGETKKKNIISDMKEKSAAKKKAKKRKAALEKARQARAANAKKAAEEKKLEADKERVLKSGTAAELAKYKGRLTNKELADAWTRLEYEAKILSRAQVESVKPDKVKDFFDRLDTVVKYTKTGIDAYDTFADVYNTFASPKNPAPKIRGGDNNKKKEENKNNNNNNQLTRKDVEELLKKYSNQQKGK